MKTPQTKTRNTTCGIVVEYNPFHAGHQHHIDQSRLLSNCDTLIAVMSPYFVQRGDIAIASPLQRAKCAIKQGVDLVVELPYPGCLESADHFAKAAIQVLEQLQITHLCFGSESNDLELLNDEANKPASKQAGLSLASSNPSTHSNDILGIAYLRALQGTAITPLLLQRTNTYLSKELGTKHVSATAIRHAYMQHQDISILTPLHETIAIEDMPQLADFYPVLRYLLMTLSASYLKTIFLMDEGIEGLFKKQAIKFDTFDAFVSSCVSKRYTRSSIMRTLAHLLLQTTKADAKELEELVFVRVLAMNEQGKKYLNHLKQERKAKEDQTPSLIVSKFRQLPKQYQELTLTMCRLTSSFQSKEVQAQALQQELVLPLIIKK